MKKYPEMYKLLRCAAILGNVAYVLWILYNGIDEGFNATPVHVASYIGILLLLILNSVLLSND